MVFNVFNDKFSDTLKLNIRDRKNDSLVLKSEQNKTLKFNDDFLISANLPLEKIEKSKKRQYLENKTAQRSIC